VTSWQSWHDDYSDPDSDLSRRLAAVQQRIRDWLAEAPAGPLRVISACAGQGHDVVGALAGSPRAADVSGLLVELDEHNAEAAERAVSDARLSLQVLRADAGHSSVYAGAVPADLLLLCGIFGNVSDDDVRRTAETASSLCAPGATVIWTRHRREPDLTPEIRGWFAAAGFAEVGFDSPGPGSWSVGTQRLTTEPAPYRDDVGLFSFAS
jgi:hypothetical protein